MVRTTLPETKISPEKVPSKKKKVIIIFMGYGKPWGCMLFKMGTYFPHKDWGGSKNKTHLGMWLSIVFSLDEGIRVDKLRSELNCMIVPVQAVGTSTFKSSQWAISQPKWSWLEIALSPTRGLSKWCWRTEGCWFDPMVGQTSKDIVDGSEILQQLRLVVYPVI